MSAFSDKPSSSGYVCNGFVDDKGNPKSIGAHIIVARAFFGEPDSRDFTVDRINREPADNRAINLRWATKNNSQLIQIYQNGD